MGYYISVMNSHFMIRQSNLPKFFELAAQMATDENIAKNGSGFTSRNGVTESRHYSWISTDLLREAIASNSIERVFEQFRYKIVLSHSVGDMNFYKIAMDEGEGKIGDEEKLFAAIAEVVEDDSFIDVRGEDGARWRWSWENGKFFSQEEEDTVIHYGPATQIVFDGITN